MMSGSNIIGISIIVLIILVFLISLIFIFLKGKWYIKIITTLSAFLLVFGTISVWKNIQGTPKMMTNLEGLTINSYLIKEPHNGNPGKIWLWGFEHEKYEEPLNIETPYSKQLHRELMENKGLKDGRAQRFRKKPGDKTWESDKQFELFDPNPIAKK
jgi:hypothetical protein